MAPCVRPPERTFTNTSTSIGPSVIRTFVPPIVGYVLALGVRLGLHLDTTAHTGLLEPVAAAGAAIFFAASKAGRDIRPHTASGGPPSMPLSTHIHPHPVAAFAVTVRSRTPEAPSIRRSKGPLTCTFTCSGGRI